MKRKKFVKQLMAYGISRNGANLAAEAAQVDSSYAETAFVLEWIHGVMQPHDMARFEKLVTDAARIEITTGPIKRKRRRR